MLSVVSRLFASDWEVGKRPPIYFWHPKDGCLSFWVKYLDSANLTNAYVTGMKEDLGLYANQLTLMGTLFTAGGLVFQIPSNLLITRIPPRLWLPGCEFVWGLCTLLLYRVTSAKQIYALRFVIGMLEGSCFVGMHWIFGSWYTRKEIGKRAALFAMVAIFGVCMFPGTPDKCTAWYLTEEEKKRCVERLREDGKGQETDIINLALAKRVFDTLGKYIGNVFALWLKQNPNKTYSVYDINNIPTSVPGANIFAILLTAWLIDVYGRRLSIIYICLATQTIGMIIVNIYDVSNSTYMAGLILGALDGPTSPILLTWCNILCFGDTQQRALTLAVMNTVASMTSVVINQFVYKVTTAPRFHQGVILSTCAVLLEWIGVTAIRYVELRTEPARLAATEAAIAESGLASRTESKEDIKEVGSARVVAVLE
ncbi:hypothetical protein RQP46_006812 [Phenoliferia psychrophenolica]